jgi:hypothetical protein
LNQRDICQAILNGHVDSYLVAAEITFVCSYEDPDLPESASSRLESYYLLMKILESVIAVIPPIVLSSQGILPDFPYVAGDCQKDCGSADISVTI